MSATTPAERSTRMLRAYEEFKPKIPLIARKFCRQHGIKDVEEMESQIVGIFAVVWPKFRAEKNPNITQFLFRRVWRGLQDWWRLIGSKERKLRVEGKRKEEALESAEDHKCREFSPKRFSLQAEPPFRKDIRFVLTLLFDGDFLSKPTPTQCRVALRDYLRNECRWSRSRMETVFGKICEILTKGD